MSRKLKYDIPGRDFRLDLEAVDEPLDHDAWSKIFAQDVPSPGGLEVDIGFGRGEFLIERATKDPSRAFVGIERSFKRTLKMARRLARLGIGNVRLVEGSAEEAIERIFCEASIECAWINFPDPWPKGRHARRRLVQAGFVHELTLRLVPGGVVNLATDDPPYAQQMDEVLAAESLLENLYAPDPYRSEDTGRIPTAYELEWRALGRSFHYFAYRRRTSGDAVDTAAGPP